MGVKRVFAPLRGDEFGKYVLDHALAIANRSAAHVDVVFIDSSLATEISDVVPLSTEMRRVIDAAILAHSNRHKEEIKKNFLAYCEENGIAFDPTANKGGNGVSVSWQDDSGQYSSMVAKRGVFYDLIVLPRPDPETRVGIDTLETTLVQSGKPVLVTPRARPEELGKHIAVAWNFTTASARAVTMCLPLIEAAERITILCADEHGTRKLYADDLKALLALHAPTVSIRQCAHANCTVGQALLNEAAAAEADLLMIGAYGHSRKSQMIFGGVTEHLIWNTDMPVLMAH